MASRAPVSELIADPQFQELKDMAIQMTGMAFYADKNDTLAAALARRMSAAGARHGRDYLKLLTGARAAEERDALAAELTIGETYFLRHMAQWTAFCDRIVPDILARNAETRQLRIWSAGCSIGAEPYTAAILLRDRFRRELEGWTVDILGTDINRRLLAAARAARYGQWSFRATPDHLRDRCFCPVGDHWELRQEFRADVRFQYHNLVRDRIAPDGMRPDIIFCRNVFIYFDRETNGRILDGFHAALPEGGWLVVGHAEPDMRLFRAYEAVMLPDAVLYRKAEAGAPARPAPSASAKAPAAVAPVAAPARPPARPARPRAAAPSRAPLAPPLPVPPPRLPPTTPPVADEVEALIAGKDWVAAASACQRWLAQDPLDPWVHVCLGMVQQERGGQAEAAESFRRALYLDRGALIAHYLLGALLLAADRGGAGRCFRNVLELSQGLEPTAPVRGVPGLTVEELRQAAQTHLSGLEPA